MRTPSITARQLFELEPVGDHRFRSRYAQTNHTAALFGGQLVAQALAAAIRVTPGKSAHSLHAYFMRPGSVDAPVDYEVEPLKVGPRVATHRVSARQDGKLLFDLRCSLASSMEGFDHQLPAPRDLPGPEGLSPLAEYVAQHADTLAPWTVANYRGPFPLELRPIHPEHYFFELLEAPQRAFWVRFPSAAEVDDPALHQCLLAFASDYWLAGVAAGCHVLPTDRTRLQILSLDHSVWFHRPVRTDEWMLYVTDSPSAQSGRGFSRGLIYDSQGGLAASIAQEALILPT